MSLYTAFVMVTLTVLAIPIAYGQWKRTHTANESVPSDHPYSKTEAHAEPEALRRAA
jgi:hypothetical protein